MKALRRVRPFMDFATADCIVSSILGSVLDHANDALLGFPHRNIQRLQPVQNTIARVVLAEKVPPLAVYTMAHILQTWDTGLQITS